MLERMKQSKCHTCPKLKEQYVAMEQRQKLIDEISELRRNLSNENLQLMPEFQQRVSVLRFLNYVDDNNAVQLKGRVAREVLSCVSCRVVCVACESCAVSCGAKVCVVCRVS